MKKYLLTIVCAASIAFISGCATTYQKNGLGGGYSETALAPDVYKVYFRGNGFTNSERTNDFAMLRAAELTLEKGYKYFVVRDSGTEINQSQYVTPVTTTTNVYGGAGYASAYSTSSGGQVYNIRRATSGLLVKMLHDNSKFGNAYDAEFIKGEMFRKYELKADGK